MDYNIVVYELWGDVDELVGIFTNRAAAEMTMNVGLGSHIRENILRGKPLPTRECWSNGYLYSVEREELSPLCTEPLAQRVSESEPLMDPYVSEMSDGELLHIYVPDAPDREAVQEQAERALAAWLAAREDKGGES
jgi:hypothetical protein